MSDIYKNYLTNETVLIAPDRNNRPNDFIRVKQHNKTNAKNCPFCIENENEKLHILYENDKKTCRIIKNKYPFTKSGEMSHEVVIDSINHMDTFHKRPIEEMADVIYGIICREKVNYEKNDIKLVCIFKNEGIDAGTSLEHSHAQMISLSYIPDKFETIAKNMINFQKENKKCYICSLEDEKDVFVFCENESFRSVTKNESFAIDILPKRHIKTLSELSSKEILDFVSLLKTTISKLQKLFSECSFNILYYNSPKIDGDFIDEFHFYVQIVPRLNSFGGFELLTGDIASSYIAKDLAEKLKNI